MHSSHLRGGDFEIDVDGRATSHADFFRGFTGTQRLGLVAPGGVDGVGAVNLVMAYVTAFYDACREQSADFFAYPDYFTFQGRQPLADYGNLDIWPAHKSVLAPASARDRLDAITDRGVNVLIVPEGEPSATDFQPQQWASARRNIHTCYVYSFPGRVNDPRIVIRCKREPMLHWARTVFDTPGLELDAIVAERKQQWESLCAGSGRVEQSYRRVSLEEGLALL